MSTEHKAVLLSIRPEWCVKILNGEKSVEIRKNRPNLKPPFKCYIYCTNKPPLIALSNHYDCLRGTFKTGVTPVTGFTRDKAEDLFEIYNGRVIGEFVCDKIKVIDRPPYAVKEDVENLLRGSGLSYEQLKDYAGWKERTLYESASLYGWHISQLDIYGAPVELSRLTALRQTKFGWEPNEIKRAPQSWCYVEENGGHI